MKKSRPEKSLYTCMPIFKFILTLLSFIFFLCFSCGISSADVDFETLYGSDLGMGIGARAIGLGGAFVSIAGDPTAVFWNPAGLTDVNHMGIFLSAEPPSDFSTASVVFSPKISFLESIDLTLGVSYVRRLRFQGDSDGGKWSGYSSHLLDLSMVDVGENFSGKINSKTCDTRISLAFTPPGFRKLSFGFNYIFLK